MSIQEAELTNEKLFTVLISDPMSEEGLKPILDNRKFQVIFEQLDETSVPLSSIDALIIRSGTKVTKKHINKMPNLKIIGRAGVGVDNIDIEAATNNGIVVVNAPDGNTISTAEHTFAMMISLLRKIPQANHSMKEGRWDRKAFQGKELYGKTLGIVGFGRIGTELARRAKAFHMDVLAYDPYLTKDRAEKNRVKSVSFETLIEQSDIISIHTPLTKETKGLLNKETIARTKKGVYLINCARGGIIDETALEEAIKEKHVAGAAIDVFEEEPAIDHPLTKLPEVITTPHIAASTTEAQKNVAEQVAVEVMEYLEGKPAQHALNLPYLEKDVFDKFAPIYHLAKMMGEVATQLMKQPVKQITLTYCGELSNQSTNIFTRSFLVGFFKHRIDRFVNEVNAPHIAKEREIQIGEEHSSDAKGYSNLIQATIIGENETLKLYGTHYNEFGSRIIQLNDFQIDFQPSKHNIFIQHNDRPGVIGKVGQLLGNHQINIATMQVGRKQEGGNAIMLLAIDKMCDDDVLQALYDVSEIASVRSLELT